MENTVATSAMDMANQATGTGARAGLYIPNETDAAPPSRFYGEEAKTNSMSPAPAVIIESAIASRVVRLALVNSPYEEILAANDPDTGVITVQIGCQSRPLQTWRRVGLSLIRRQWSHDTGRLEKALTEVLDRVEAEFAK